MLARMDGDSENDFDVKLRGCRVFVFLMRVDVND